MNISFLVFFDTQTPGVLNSCHYKNEYNSNFILTPFLVESVVTYQVLRHRSEDEEDRKII